MPSRSASTFLTEDRLATGATFEERLAAALLAAGRRLYSHYFFAAGLRFAAGFLATRLAAGFLAATFFAAGFLAAVFLAAGFLAAGFFLATAFLAAGFLAAGFLAATFFAAGFLAAAFFTAGFLAAGFFFAAGFLAAGFFLAAVVLAASFFTAGFFFAAGFLAAGFFTAAFLAAGFAFAFVAMFSLAPDVPLVSGDNPLTRNAHTPAPKYPLNASNNMSVTDHLCNTLLQICANGYPPLSTESSLQMVHQRG